MISVEVAVFATLRRYRPDGDGGAFWLDVPQGTTVDDLVDMLGIPASEMKQTFVDSVRQEGGHVLKDKERVAIFPPIAGG